MDLLDQSVTLRDIAAALRCSYNAMRQAVHQEPGNPSRGTLRLHFLHIPIFRVGRVWLARQADVQAVLSPGAAPAPQAPAADLAPRRRPGRPRKSSIADQVGSQK
ncbi:MAG: hypothetical protein ACOY44_07680 [Pseudomonadota bacterium]